MNYTWVTYTLHEVESGLKVEYAIGTLSYKKVGEFWLPLNPVGFKKSDTTYDIIKRKISHQLNITVDKIHLSYFTGNLEDME